MAKHKSAIKRHRQSVERNARNRSVKTRVRTLVKRTRAAIDRKDSETAATRLAEATKALDKAASKGVLKKNAAARRISRLSTQLQRIRSGATAS